MLSPLSYQAKTTYFHVFKSKNVNNLISNIRYLRIISRFTRLFSINGKKFLPMEKSVSNKKFLLIQNLREKCENKLIMLIYKGFLVSRFLEESVIKV